MFINVFRPGYWDNAEKTPVNLKDRMTDLSLVELVLQPLDSQSSETLINNMLNIKGLHHGVKAQIIERAGGNPFFIEEVVRALIDEGAVVVKDGGFEVTDKINSVVIPPTINDVLMARIDRLDEESRNVVKVASVIGRSFFYRILADVISHVDGLDDKLEYLKQIQLIRERIQMNELEYLFKHALAQEAAYESTLLQQRKQLHLNEIFDLSYKLAVGLAFVDLTRASFVALTTLRRTTRYDLGKIPNGPQLWLLGSSGDFSAGVISFKLADRFLRYGRDTGSTGEFSPICQMHVSIF